MDAPKAGSGLPFLTSATRPFLTWRGSRSGGLGILAAARAFHRRRSLKVRRAVRRRKAAC